MTPALALDELVLGHGNHRGPDDGFCVMEAVAYVNNEPWSAAPKCVSPVISSFLVSWNDSLSQDDRQMLKPYILRVAGTNTGKKDDETRAWLATDWLVRECAPAWLRLAGLTDHAEALEKLAALTSPAKARKAQPKIEAARATGAAAWDAARAAAGAAARAAARAAAGAAAGAAAWDAAGAAAGAALVPTTKGLQQSALLLLDRMIAVGQSASPVASPAKSSGR